MLTRVWVRRSVTLKEVRTENKKIRMTLTTTSNLLDEFKQKYADEVAKNKALHKENKKLANTVQARKDEVREFQVSCGRF